MKKDKLIRKTLPDQEQENSQQTSYSDTNGDAHVLTERLYDRQDMLQHFKMSVGTLNNWRKNGIIGFVEINKKIYYPESEVKKMIDRNTKK